ncbi:MAG TPA: hypothetical protein VH063_07705 [Gaiellaceae bacterium]|nr:hypothetical protein [Gaiellaceae bacterium]
MIVFGLFVWGSTASASGPALMQEQLPKYGVSLQVPDGWFTGSASGLGSSPRPVAVYRSPVEHDGFTANINLLVGKLQPGETLRQWVLGGSGAIYLSRGKLTSAHLDGTPALVYESTRLVAILGHQLLTLEYAAARGSRVYLFTYTALALDRAKYEQTFKASAATIQFI